MLKNHFKIAWRNLLRNKLYSGINIAGLTIGLAACLVVTTVVLNELSYDRQWTHSRDLYRVISTTVQTGGTERSSRSFSGLGPALKKNFPEVTGYCRMSTRSIRLGLGKEKEGVALHCLEAEPSVWQLLDFRVLDGQPENYTKAYTNLVISEKLKQTYFPHTNPVGQTIENISNVGRKTTYLITGVIQNMPSNSHLFADALVINELSPVFDQLNRNEAGSFLEQYLLFRPGTDLAAFTHKANRWYQAYLQGKKAGFSYSFQPIRDIHLHSDFGEADSDGANARDIYIFSGVAILLLLIACINFVNLASARVLKRIHETGVRKVLGAGRGQLAGQFLCESILFFGISFSLAMVLYDFSIPPVAAYIGHPLATGISHNASLFAAIFGAVLLVSLLTGLYPAWQLSRPKPVTILKGNAAKNMDAGFLRKGLIIGQFTIAITLIIVMIVVRSQLFFLDHKDLGFDKNNLLKTSFIAWGKQGKAFKQEVLQLPGVENACITKWIPTEGGGFMSREIPDPADSNHRIIEWYIDGDIDLVSTLRLQLEKGRSFDATFSADTPNSDSLMETDFETYEAGQNRQPVLITAYTARRFGVKKLNEPVKGILGIPVGIVKDFNNESLHTALKPCILRAAKNPAYGSLLVRVSSPARQQVLGGLHRLLQKFYPEKVFEYDWVDQLLAKQYRAEQKLQQLFTFFSGLTVFLACLGLFGLVTFSVAQRTREIGIRKVIGASVMSITTLLSFDFLKLVGLAILVAAPIGWYAMHRWLEDYAYRIPIHAWVFGLAGGAAVLLAMATISVQAVRAAGANPVESLRAE